MLQFSGSNDFVPMVGKDGDPVVTGNGHHRSSEFDFQVGWARSGFNLRWHMTMMMTGKSSSAGHGTDVTNDLPSPGSSPATLQSFGSCHNTRHSRT